jgi:hypothetical protein
MSNLGATLSVEVNRIDGKSCVGVDLEAVEGVAGGHSDIFEDISISGTRILILIVVYDYDLDDEDEDFYLKEIKREISEGRKKSRPLVKSLKDSLGEEYTFKLVKDDY